MIKRFQKAAAQRLRSGKPNVTSSSGFTLIELLVTLIVAGGILSGLLYLTVELLQSDQRESNRTETQRDMQLALDFISSELRQAVYVYENDCLRGTDDTGAVVCDGITPALLGLPANMTPVLAFWKLQPLPQDVKQACSGALPPAAEPEENPPAVSDKISCISGNSYTLVVYSLGLNTDDEDQLQGKAGIYRSMMTVNDIDADGYVSPLNAQEPLFRSWPPDGQTPTFTDPNLLVDFVDDATGDAAGDPSCPANYQLTPNLATDPPRSFYACVSTNRTQDNPELAAVGTYFGNQDVIVYLRGNASGRSGLMTDRSFLPSLESRVFIRGALEKTP